MTSPSPVRRVGHLFVTGICDESRPFGEFTEYFGAFEAF